MDGALLKRLNQERDNRLAAIIVRNINTDEARLICEGDTVEAQFVPLVDAAFHTGKSRLHEVDDQQYLFNVYLPPTRLVVIGAVHISQCLAKIAGDTGFDLEIIDPRTAFATPERFEGIALYPDWPDAVFEKRPLDRYCALIALTHDPKIDDFAIQAGLQADCFYVGALGSRKTHAKRMDRLGEQGVAVELLANIHGPIGLNIAAANPAEIAVAILAQVIERFRKRGLGT